MPGNSIDRLRFSNAFIRLGPEFYQLKAPDPVPSPTLIHFNPGAAPLIGLDPAEGTKEEFVLTFAGNRALPGAEPLAMAYSGHQFGVYNPRLGDGRGHYYWTTTTCDQVSVITDRYQEKICQQGDTAAWLVHFNINAVLWFHTTQEKPNIWLVQSLP